MRSLEMNIRKILFLILILIFILIISFLNISIVYLNAPSPLTKSIELILPHGSTRSEISSKLYDAGVIKYPALFSLYLKLYGIKYKIKSGEYSFTSKISPRQVIQILIEGKSIIHKLTIPEGLTVNDILTKIDAIEILTGEISRDVPEGYLFPSTYFYSYGDQKQKIIDLMRNKMSKIIDKYISDLHPSSTLKTRLDVLILASIIEKETIISDEKPRIAQVYLNRMQKKMKLQADPTTIYAITLGKTPMDRMLTLKDLKIASPFNTYHVFGLPPTPICCPGEEAIKAAVFPLKSTDLYFVSEGNGSGRHYFAEKFSDHQNNIKKYKKAR
jgi:UPF0755 protein